MQLEAKEPAGGGLAPLGQPGKHLVRVDALVETNINGGGVDEGDARAIAQTAGAQVDQQRDQDRGDVLDKAGVANQTGELAAPVLQHVFTVVGFEVPIVRLMKGYQDGHDLTHRQ